jgi:Ca2+-transporting ATPase
LRSFGARSETKQVWRISLFTNLNLIIVVAVSFGLQVWSQHNAIVSSFVDRDIAGVIIPGLQIVNWAR